MGVVRSAESPFQDAGLGHQGRRVPSAGHCRSTWNPRGADVRGSEALPRPWEHREACNFSELVMSHGVASSIWSLRLRCGVTPAFRAGWFVPN